MGGWMLVLPGWSLTLSASVSLTGGCGADERQAAGEPGAGPVAAAHAAGGQHQHRGDLHRPAGWRAAPLRRGVATQAGWWHRPPPRGVPAAAVIPSTEGRSGGGTRTHAGNLPPDHFNCPDPIPSHCSLEGGGGALMPHSPGLPTIQLYCTVTDRSAHHVHANKVGIWASPICLHLAHIPAPEQQLHCARGSVLALGAVCEEFACFPCDC